MAVYNGTNGNDVYSGTAVSDTINGYGGADNLAGGDGTDFVDGGDGNDTVIDFNGIDADLFADTLNGGGGNDIIIGGLLDNIDGGSGIDQLVLLLDHAPGGISFDFTALWSGATYTLAGATIQGMEKLDNCHGSAFGDMFITGTPSSETGSVLGLGGSDLLIGGAGVDYLYAHSGIGPANVKTDTDYDELYGLGGNDFLSCSIGDYVDGGSGIDELSLDLGTGSIGASIHFNTLLITGDDTILGTTFISIEDLGAVMATNGSDSINASFDSNGTVLYGRDGNDILVTGNGDDDLYGDSGADTLHGGGGNDEYYVDNAGDIVVEGNGNGNDRIISTISWTLDNNVEQLSLDIYAGAINGTGNDLDNRLHGNEATNILNGGAGNDYMSGGGGNDTYFVDSAGDSVFEIADFGTDLVISSVNYWLLNHLENLTLTGTAAINGYGNAAANIITGNDSVNQLFSNSNMDDHETLIDQLIGGAGNDQLSIGYGDSADGGIGSDQLRLSLRAATAGVTLHTSALTAGHTLTLGGGTLTGIEYVTHITGSAFNDVFVIQTQSLLATIDAGDGDDITSSVASAVQFFGGNGNDRFISGTGGDVFDGGAGIDTVDYRNASGGLWVQLEGATPGSAGFGGGDSLIGVERVDGSAFNDVVIGDGNDNVLNGLNGDDTLRGGGGNDTLVGGNGADTLTGGTGSDQFLFNTAPGAGQADTITDFVSGTDGLLFNDAVFAALTPGTLSGSAFRLGTSAQDADDRLVYDQVTGALWYDADGNGAGAAVLIVSLGAGTILAASDIGVF